MLSLPLKSRHTYLINQTKTKAEIAIHNKLIQDYQTNSLDYGITLIKSILYNESSHFVVLYKELLIIDNPSECLIQYYSLNESNQRLHKLINYYDKYSKIFPNYNAINEGKYLFRNIQRKQIMIDLQEEMENEQEKEHDDNDKKRKEDKGIEDVEIKNELFDTDIYESIVNDNNNQEEIGMMFGINNGNDNHNKDDAHEKDEENEMIQCIESIIKKIDNKSKRIIKKIQSQSCNSSLGCIINNSHTVVQLPSNLNEIKPKLSFKNINEKVIKKHCFYSLIENYLKDKLSSTMKSKKEFKHHLIGQLYQRDSSNLNNSNSHNHNNNSSMTKITSKKDFISNDNNSNNNKGSATVRFSHSTLGGSTLPNQNGVSVQIKGKDNLKQLNYYYNAEQNITKKRSIISRNFNSTTQLSQKVNKSAIQKRSSNNNSSNNLSNYAKHDRSQNQLKGRQDIGLINHSSKDIRGNNGKGITIVNSIVSRLKNIKMNNKPSRNTDAFQTFLRETLKMINDSSKSKLKVLDKTRSNENLRNKSTEKEGHIQMRERKTPYKIIFTKDKKIVTNTQEGLFVNSYSNNNINVNGSNGARAYEYQSCIVSNKALNNKGSKLHNYFAKEAKR